MLFALLLPLGIAALLVFGIIFLVRKIGSSDTGSIEDKAAHCHQCGKPIDDEWAVCPYCGEELGGG